MRAGKAIPLMLAMVIAMGLLGAGYAWSSTTNGEHTVSLASLSLGYTGVTCSDPPGTLDLGTVPPKDVGWTECTLVDSDADGDYDDLQVEVFNGYPGYQVMVSDITVQNMGTVPMFITGASLTHNDDPVALVLEGFWTEFSPVCALLEPGEQLAAELWLSIGITQPALQGYVYTFGVDITGEQWNQACQPEDLGGTPGFWKCWDSHDTYTRQEIEAWLREIDDASSWLGPTTTGGMETMLGYGKSQAKPKFLKHYLATRLNAASGRLALGNVHDVSGIDHGNYLGLPNPTAAPLSAIIAAIESKYGTYPTNNQFLIMKDIADALNNLLL